MEVVAPGRPGALAPAAATAAALSPSHTAAGNQPTDRHGIWRDTSIFFGAQIAAVGVIFLLPESFSGWSEEQKDSSFSNWWRNARRPNEDTDDFYVNYLLHPYWGATYYIRARERGLSPLNSFLFSTMISTMYEFGVECFFEKPSTQDLVITPLFGSLLGAFVFEPWRESIKRKPELHWHDDAVLILTDPVGVLTMLVEKMLGIKPTVRFGASISQHGDSQTHDSSKPYTTASRNSHVGIQLQFPLN